MTEKQQLEAGIDALEAQRAALGDAVVDAAIGGLRSKLAALQARSTSEPAQTLRQVSILFLDAVGSTALGAHLDPEEISAVMDGLLSRGTVIVASHRGKVLKYTGDNLLAVFGADEVAEDDAERAVRCGLALLELGRSSSAEVEAAYGYTGFGVRVGVHTGAVLLGGGVDEEGSIRGQAVNSSTTCTGPTTRAWTFSPTWRRSTAMCDVVAGFRPADALRTQGKLVFGERAPTNRSATARQGHEPAAGHRAAEEGARSSRGTARTVIGGAEGNPFYMEELVKMLVDQGAIETGEVWTVNAERLQGIALPPFRRSACPLWRGHAGRAKRSAIAPPPGLFV